ncbi:MAG: GPR endopeptidase [Oscillospiraceae bacterium]
MFIKRTDLALESRELWQESAAKTTKLPGVKAKNSKREGYPTTRVDILNADGAAALGKPIGTYLTLDLTGFWARKPGFFERAVHGLGAELKAMLPREGAALIVGLGNAAMTPDAVGPQVTEHLLVTRHLLQSMPKQFAGFRPVSVLRTGVLGTTGLESAEQVAAVVEKIQPAFVIVVDALAARRLARVCATIQLSDTGLCPGSGVGNHRAALDAETLGVPVYAIGVPTVVDGGTLAADLLEEAGVSGFDPATLGDGAQLMVTPSAIDGQVRDLSKVIGYAINWALQDLDIEEINSLLS